MESGNSRSKSRSFNPKSKSFNRSSTRPGDENNQDNVKKIDIEELAKGVTNEKLWLEKSEKDLEGLKKEQELNLQQQNKFKEYVDQSKVSKEELAEIVRNLEAGIEEKYNKRLAEELARLKPQEPEKPASPLLESRNFKPKIKVKKVGEYIPANSYTKAKLISGVDAPVGVSGSVDPKQVLIRITGEVVSAGIGSNYIKTSRLVGCQVAASAIGDISSEKVNLSLVSITCPKDANSVIELAVKGYASSLGKVGIRGEVISREGDLVLKSFLSGLSSGIGSGISQLNSPHMAMSSAGMLTTEHQKARNIAFGGIGSGAASSGDRLSEYFIKKAEQYQPVISIDAGTEVEIVFQEGFSLAEGREDEKSSK